MLRGWRKLTIPKLDSPVPGPKVQQHDRQDTPSWREVDRHKQSGENKHGALEEVEKSPLRLIIRIFGVVCPSGPNRVYQIFDGSSPRRAGIGACGVKPIRIGLLCRIVCPSLGDEPAQDGGGGCWKDQTKGSSEGAGGQVREGGFDLASSCKLDRFQGVHETGEDDEHGDPSGTLCNETKDGSLHEMGGAILAITGNDNPSSKSHGHMAEHDEYSCNAPKTLCSSAIRVEMGGKRSASYISPAGVLQSFPVAILARSWTAISLFSVRAEQ